MLTKVKPSKPEFISEYIERKYIQELGLSKSQIANLINKSRAYVTMMINGERKVTDAVIADLKKIQGSDTTELMRIKGENDRWEKSDEGIRYRFGEKEIKRKITAQNYTQTLTDEELVEYVENKYLGIEPFDKKQIQPTSIDLRFGGKYRLFTGDSENPIIDCEVDTGEGLTLKRGQTAILYSKEIIRLPERIFGRIGPHSDLITDGLITTVGPIVDPGFNDHVFMNVCNPSLEEIEIAYKQNIISMELSLLGIPPKEIYDGAYSGKNSQA